MYLGLKYTSFVVVSLFCLYVFTIRITGKHGFDEDRYDKTLNGIAMLMDRYWLAILMLLFGVFCFTRFYALSIVPAGVHLDEIGYWYDAHNLAKYGTDRMGSRYPVLPASYGDGHNPFYCYMCMVMLKFFPFSVGLMRAVMGISAIPCFFASFGIVYQMYESRRWALLGPVFVLVTPYIFAANRWGLNANQMLYVCTVMLYFFVCALKYGRVRDYILTGVFLGISLLTYHLSYIMMPLFFIMAFGYLIVVGKFSWKNMFAAFIPFAVIGMPTFIEQLVNLGLVEPFYFMGSDYQKLLSYRVGEIAPVNFVKNIGNIIPLVFGDTQYNYNSVKEFGTVYWAMIPLMAVGAVIGAVELVRSVKDKRMRLLSLFILYGLSIYIGFISVVGCNVYKGNAIYICFIVLAVEGLRYIAGDKKQRNRLIVLAVLAVIAFSFLLYSEFYFRRLNNAYGLQALFKSTEPGDMLKYEEETYNPDHSKKVYMELNYEDRDYAEWMLALYLELEPAVFNKYDFGRKEMESAGASQEEIFKTLWLDNIQFAFPENYDENEDAVYILGYNWDHIAAYLIDTGYECDTSFPGYKILHK